MRKRVTALILAAMFSVTACSGTGAAENGKEQTEAAAEKDTGASATEKVDQMAGELKEKAGDSVKLPSESVAMAVSGTWEDQNSGDVYVLSEDGTGTKNGENLTFECGFDDDNNITIRLMPEGEKEGTLYIVSTDNTGYGIRFMSMDGEETIALLPQGLHFLDLTDERVSGLIGTWTDGGGNTYRLNDDNSMVITDSEKETEGVFHVAENADGTLLLKLKVSGGSLEFTYHLNEDKTGLDLQTPGDETIHHWTRK